MLRDVHNQMDSARIALIVHQVCHGIVDLKHLWSA